jgi:hypothetical protein
MGELIPIAEATRRLGVSKSTMLRRLKSANIRRYINPKDSRQRLIDWDEVEELFTIRPEDEPKKVAA